MCNSILWCFQSLEAQKGPFTSFSLGLRCAMLHPSFVTQCNVQELEKNKTSRRQLSPGRIFGQNIPPGLVFSLFSKFSSIFCSESCPFERRMLQSTYKIFCTPVLWNPPRIWSERECTFSLDTQWKLLAAAVSSFNSKKRRRFVLQPFGQW